MPTIHRRLPVGVSPRQSPRQSPTSSPIPMRKRVRTKVTFFQGISGRGLPDQNLDAVNSHLKQLNWPSHHHSFNSSQPSFPTNCTTEVQSPLAAIARALSSTSGESQPGLQCGYQECGCPSYYIYFYVCNVQDC